MDTTPPLLGQDSLEQLLRRQCQEAAAQEALRAAQPVAAAAAGPAAADAYRGTSLKRHMARPSPSPFGSAAPFCSVPGGSLHAAAQQAGWPAEASMGQAQQPAVSGSGSAMAEPAADLLPFSFVPGPTLGLHPLPWPTSPAAAPQQPAASGSPGLPVAQPAASAAAATTCMERAASTVAASAGNVSSQQGQWRLPGLRLGCLRLLFLGRGGLLLRGEVCTSGAGCGQPPRLPRMTNECGPSHACRRRHWCG